MPTLKSRVEETEQPTAEDVRDLVGDTLAQFTHMVPSYGEFHLIIVSILTTVLTMDVISDYVVSPVANTPGLFEVGVEMGTHGTFHVFTIQV